MKTLHVCMCSLLAIGGLAGNGVAIASTTIIDFDDRPGGPPTPDSGFSIIEPQFIISDEYAGIGVLFDSGGGGVHLSAASNPVSSPNLVSATAPGPRAGIGNPIFATFSLGTYDAVVDFVSIDLSDSSHSGTTLSVFDINNVLLGTDAGGASATLQFAENSSIHSIRVDGVFAFDNFTFSGLQPVPEPNTAALAAFGLLGLVARGRRRRTR